MDILAWSWSRLDMFEGCPLLFLHTHILKTIKFVKNDAMIRGELVHKKLERNVVRAISGQPGIEGKPGPNNMFHVQPIIEAFVHRHPSIYIEEELAFTKRWGQTSWFAKNVWLRAKLDLIGFANPLSNKNGKVVSILDWKTGQVRDKPEQLRLYNLVALMRWKDIAQVSSAFVFVDHSKSGKVVTSTREDIDNLKNEFCDRAEAIQIAKEQNNWPAIKNFRCRWCGVNDCQYVCR